MLAAGRRWRSDIDHMVRELRVELARDSEISGYHPIEFHLRAVGRQLFLPGDARASQIFRVAAVEFPFGDALSCGARRHAKKYHCRKQGSVQFPYPPELDKNDGSYS